VCCNLPFAYFSQLFFIQPLVRVLFNDEAQGLEKDRPRQSPMYGNAWMSFLKCLHMSADRENACRRRLSRTESRIMQKENKMAVMPMPKLVVTMSIPHMLSLLIQSLYNIVDSIFVAMLSERALTAIPCRCS
jgi:hypothetical protein